MILSEETKNKIKKEFEAFKKEMYKGLTKEQRKELGMVYTPAELSIRMIEKFDCASLANKNILDPCCGSGNLLAACLFAGADSDKIFGNEYTKEMVTLARERLNNVCDLLGKPHIQDWQIHQGNALQKLCLTDFSPEYEKNYKVKYIDDLTYAQENYQANETVDLFGGLF